MSRHELTKGDLLPPFVAYVLELVLHVLNHRLDLGKQLLIKILAWDCSSQHALDLSNRDHIDFSIFVLGHELLQSLSAVDIFQKCLLVDESRRVELSGVITRCQMAFESTEIDVLVSPFDDLFDSISRLLWCELGKFIAVVG